MAEDPEGEGKSIVAVGQQEVVAQAAGQPKPVPPFWVGTAEHILEQAGRKVLGSVES